MLFLICRLEDIQESADVFKQFLSENHSNSIPLNTITIQALLWVIIEIEIDKMDLQTK